MVTPLCKKRVEAQKCTYYSAIIDSYEFSRRINCMTFLIYNGYIYRRKVDPSIVINTGDSPSQIEYIRASEQSNDRVMRRSSLYFIFEIAYTPHSDFEPTTGFSGRQVCILRGYTSNTKTNNNEEKKNKTALTW